jgi:ABC-2 type transport system ATP-binding protein/lipopolysaccharide transport system ATP-binding protein
VDLVVEEGSQIGLLGPNGAGKSTLLKVAAGLLHPTHGSVEIHRPVFSLLGEAAAALNMEESGFDNLHDLATLYGSSRKWFKSHVDEIVSRSGLQSRLDDPLYTYSTGMIARLRISVLLSFRPEILIIDEGIGAADHNFSLSIRDELDGFMRGAGVLLLASHNESLVRGFCKILLVMRDGRIESTEQIK